MPDNKELENFRTEMVDAFHAYCRGQGFNARRELWDAYVGFRERFLRLDCQLKGLEYQPLKTCE